jgi:hypothetical protein
MANVLWPKMFWSVIISQPPAANKLAATCLVSWNLKSVIPVFEHAALKASLIQLILFPSFLLKWMEQDLASSGAIHHHVFHGYIDAFFYLCFYKLTLFFSVDILVPPGKLTMNKEVSP